MYWLAELHTCDNAQWLKVGKSYAPYTLWIWLNCRTVREGTSCDSLQSSSGRFPHVAPVHPASE